MSGSTRLQLSTISLYYSQSATVVCGAKQINNYNIIFLYGIYVENFLQHYNGLTIYCTTSLYVSLFLSIHLFLSSFFLTLFLFLIFSALFLRHSSIKIKLGCCPAFNCYV